MSAAEAAAPARAGPLFSPITALWVVLVGVFSFAALAVLFAYAPDLRSGDNGDAHALSKSAIGFAGIVELLQDRGDAVVISRTRIDKTHKEGLLIATPDFGVQRKSIDALGFGGPELVVLPKWMAAPDPLHRGWVQKAAPFNASITDKDALMAKGAFTQRKGVSRPVLHGVGDSIGVDVILRPGAVEALQTFTAPGWIPVIEDETGGVILARDAKRPLYVLSDPDLMNTHGLKDFGAAQTAVAVIDALRAGDGPVIFDVTLNGMARERSILRLLFDPPFLAVTLCVAVAAGLAGYQAACRFGPIRRTARVFALGKEALADNSAGLIRLAGREHRMGGRYAALTRAIAARAVGAPRELTGDALTGFLDRLGRQRGAADTLAELTTLATAAQDRDRLTAAAQRLFHWRLEMTRERQ